MNMQNEEIPQGAHAIVAMSGGVDSSVCAALLQKNGVQVYGVTMQHHALNYEIAGAQKVCAFLGIPHYVVNLVSEYQQFLQTAVRSVYACGETPNPCVLCNPQIKFGLFIERALQQTGLCPLTTYWASGHYARIVKQNDYYYLAKAVCEEKDQSYFLYRLSQQQLAHLRFPLGTLTKTKARQLAYNWGLPTHNTPDSQDFCLGQQDLRPKQSVPVNLYNTKGQFLAPGRFIANYTIGQRRGLGVTGPEPLYVIKIDGAHKRVILGPEQALYQNRCFMRDVVFNPQQVFPLKGDVRIRSMGKESPATITREDTTYCITFTTPQRAITPGQSAVIYQNDIVIGGGFINTP